MGPIDNKTMLDQVHAVQGVGGGVGVIVDTVEFSKWRYFISINVV